MKVFLDPGHGGKDPGAIGNGLQEKDIVLSLALKTGGILKQHGLDVLYSRATDIFIDLSERARMANSAKADVFVSIHCNAANTGARGVETYSYPGSAQGVNLAKAIQDALIQSKVFPHNRGNKVANFAVLRETAMPAALAEIGFISNAEDVDLLLGRQDVLAKALADGVLTYLNIPEKKDEKLQDIKVLVKDKELSGRLIEGQTWIPLRTLVEALNNQVIWDEKDKAVTIK